MVDIELTEGQKPQRQGQAMNHNRLSNYWEEEGGVSVAVARVEPAAAFAACPAGIVLAPWQQLLYQEAYERARALVAPWPPCQIWN
jgi:hypothetical protein